MRSTRTGESTPRRLRRWERFERSPLFAGRWCYGPPFWPQSRDPRPPLLRRILPPLRPGHWRFPFWLYRYGGRGRAVASRWVRRCRGAEGRPAGGERSPPALPGKSSHVERYTGQHLDEQIWRGNLDTTPFLPVPGFAHCFLTYRFS